jgi:Bacterial Ig-like domain (group 1)/PKD domain
MLAHFRRDDALVVSAAVLLAVAIPLGVVSCDKVPLLAPTGTVLTLLATSDTAQLNSSVDLIATAIENGQASAGTGTGTTTPATRTGAGTPVQNGTVITFTTTIGRIEPTEARTHNGQVTVKLITAGTSGTATVTAYSGGASTNLQIRVGAAADDHVLLTASPQTLGPSGGTSTISARVEDVSGSGVPGVPVTFTTDAGSLSPPTANTDSNGSATTTLTTSQRATITANVAGKTATVVIGLNPRTGVTLTGPTTAIAAGVPASFTVGVSATANIRNVNIDFGDGTSQQLGALSGSTTVQHTYNTSGSFTVTATATDASGFSEQVATSITILPAQPPAVTITASNPNPGVGETVILTATASGATSTILSYQWDLGANATPPNAQTTGNQVTVSWGVPGTKIITVTVVQASGPTGNGQTAVVVHQ